MLYYIYMLYLLNINIYHIKYYIYICISKYIYINQIHIIIYIYYIYVIYILYIIYIYICVYYWKYNEDAAGCKPQKSTKTKEKGKHIKTHHNKTSTPSRKPLATLAPMPAVLQQGLWRHRQQRPGRAVDVLDVHPVQIIYIYRYMRQNHTYLRAIYLGIQNRATYI